MLLSEIARQTGCTLSGDDVEIQAVADLGQARSGELAFVNHASYLPALETTRASAVIIKPVWKHACKVAALETDNPRLAFARAARLLNPEPPIEAGVAASAVIAESAALHASVHVGAHAVIGENVRLDEDVRIGAGCVIGDNVRIGAGCRLHANVVIEHDCVLGERCIVFAGTVIGADGFGYVKDGEAYMKVPQLGRVVIGDDVEIGANTCIDRGALLDTVIGDGVKIDNHVQIAHNVEIGRHTVISAFTGIAGSTRVGEGCLIGGGVGIRDNIEVAAGAVITGRSFVSSSISEPGVYSSSVLIDTNRNWKKNVMRFKQLDAMAQRLNKLEKALAALQGGQTDQPDQQT